MRIYHKSPFGWFKKELEPYEMIFKKNQRFNGWKKDKILAEIKLQVKEIENNHELDNLKCKLFVKIKTYDISHTLTLNSFIFSIFAVFLSMISFFYSKIPNSSTDDIRYTISMFELANHSAQIVAFVFLIYILFAIYSFIRDKSKYDYLEFYYATINEEIEVRKEKINQEMIKNNLKRNFELMKELKETSKACILKRFCNIFSKNNF